nr:MAG TPA: hypothetical protein [Caudoviricetes sp.]
MSHLLILNFSKILFSYSFLLTSFYRAMAT